jgi:hypothetical protein
MNFKLKPILKNARRFNPAGLCHRPGLWHVRPAVNAALSDRSTLTRDRDAGSRLSKRLEQETWARDQCHTLTFARLTGYAVPPPPLSNSMTNCPLSRMNEHPAGSEDEQAGVGVPPEV